MPVAVRVVPPPVQEAVKPVIGEPPSDEGAVKATEALPLPAVTVPIVGAPGVPRGVALTPAEAVPAPAELVAATVQL